MVVTVNNSFVTVITKKLDLTNCVTVLSKEYQLTGKCALITVNTGISQVLASTITAP